jgi:hypothetical protein
MVGNFFRFLNLWFLIQLILSKKIIGIQSRPDLNEQKIYDKIELFLDMY